MPRKIISLFIISFLCLFAVDLGAQEETDNCSSFLVTKGASKDGAVMITYTCDGEFVAALQNIPAKEYGPDDYFEITGRNGKLRGKIKQRPHSAAAARCVIRMDCFIILR
jgi:hypothetical protein